MKKGAVLEMLRVTESRLSHHQHNQNVSKQPLKICLTVARIYNQLFLIVNSIGIVRADADACGRGWVMVQLCAGGFAEFSEKSSRVSAK